MFVKPVLYVVELIFGCVVTCGTADKMLLLREGGGVRCLLSSDESPYLGPCVVSIIFGMLALLLLLFTLWRRLIAAFDDESGEKKNELATFTNGVEATLCLVVAFIWLIVAAILSHYTKIPDGDTLIGEKIVHLVFAWLLLVFSIASAAIAWLVPEHDGNTHNYLNLHSTSTAHTPVDPYAVRSEGSEYAVAQPPPLAAIDEENEHDNDETEEPNLTRGITLISTNPPTLGLPSPISISSPPPLSGDTASTPLTRQNAARPLSSAPETQSINNKLNEWDRLIEGPPQNDAHADALESASRIPLTFNTNNSRASQPSLRRRNTAAVVPTSNTNDEDQILPDFSKIQ